jgi:hypothetical protein
MDLFFHYSLSAARTSVVMQKIRKSNSETFISDRFIIIKQKIDSFTTTKTTSFFDDINKSILSVYESLRK